MDMLPIDTVVTATTPRGNTITGTITNRGTGDDGTTTWYAITLPGIMGRTTNHWVPAANITAVHDQPIHIQCAGCGITVNTADTATQDAHNCGNTTWVVP